MYWWGLYIPPQRSQLYPRRSDQIWTVFWCRVTVLTRDWHWRSWLGTGLANWLKSKFFDNKAPLRCVLTEKEPLTFSENIGNFSSENEFPDLIFNYQRSYFVLFHYNIIFLFCRNVSHHLTHQNQKKTCALGLTISKASF